MDEVAARDAVNRATAAFPHDVIHVVWRDIARGAYDFRYDLEFYIFLSDRFGGNLTPPPWMQEPGAPPKTPLQAPKKPPVKEPDAYDKLMDEDLF
jgi:hypothetical protein